MNTYVEDRLQEIRTEQEASEPARKPRVGDIWSSRWHERRVRVVRVWEGGSVALRTVQKSGSGWVDKKAGKSSTCRGDLFPEEFRLIQAAP